MKKPFALVLSSLVLTFALFANDDIQKEKKAVIQTVEEAYVKGIHTNGDAEAIRKGFHENFVMFVNRNGKVTHVGREEWIARIEESKKKNPERPTPEVRANFPVVEITGNAAVIKIELYKNDEHIFTDYMSLYKFGDHWKIVGKIYESHH